MHYRSNASSILIFNILYVFAFIKIMYYECWNNKLNWIENWNLSGLGILHNLFAILFESLVKLLSILNESDIPLLSLFVPINYVILVLGKLTGIVIMFAYSFDNVQIIYVIN